MFSYAPELKVALLQLSLPTWTVQMLKKSIKIVQDLPKTALYKHIPAPKFSFSDQHLELENH